MPVVGARAIERMNVPGAGPVPVPVGEEAWLRSRSAVPGTVVPVAVREVTMAVSVMPVTMHVMPVPMRAIPVAMTVGAVRATVVPVGAWMNPVRMEVERVGVPVVSVGVPPLAVRPGRRRGVGMGHREEGDEGPEREPRDRIASAPSSVPVVVPPPRLGGAGDGQQGRKREYRQPHRASSRTEAPGRAPANVRNVHPAPSRSAASHSRLPHAGVKPAARGYGNRQPATRPGASRKARDGRPLLRDADVYTIVRDAD